MSILPASRKRIGDNLSLIDGNYPFFSRLQTLTIPVNLQGIMGRGAISNAYQELEILPYI